MVWLPCLVSNDYQVSDDGEVRRVVRILPRGRRTPYLLGKHLGSSGYLFVSLSVDGVANNHLVHKLVLTTFVGERPSPKHQGAHLDGNELNNSLENLAWVTRQENAAHKRLHGTAFVPRKLQEADVIRMRGLYLDSDISYRNLGLMFGVSAATAHGVVVGRYWPHIAGATVSKSKGRRTPQPDDPIYNSDDYI